jgi:hypothetical protein
MWKKDVLIGATTCLIRCDSVSYDDFLTVSWKMEHERSRDFRFKATNMKASLRVVENIFSVAPVT